MNALLNGAVPHTGNATLRQSLNAELAVDPGAYVLGTEADPAHRQLERKYRLLQRKFARFVEKMNGKVDEEVIEKTLAEIGLDRPKATAVAGPRTAGRAFDRLYADALRRMQILRERTAEVQALQVAELRHCSDAARDRGGKKKVEQLKGLHSKTVDCANALHEALENFHMNVTRAALGEDGEDDNEAIDSVKKEGRRRPSKRQDTYSEDKRQSIEEPHLIKTGLAVLEQFPGATEFVTPRTRHQLVEPVHTEHCKSQGSSPPQVQHESGCRAKSTGRINDGGWRSAFGESPPKRKSNADLGDSAALPREIQALAQRLRNEQRPKTKAFNGESGSVVARARDTGRLIPGGGKASRSLPSLQRPGASRFNASNWPIGTGRSPRSPPLQRPSSGPCSMAPSAL
jgi:hypothetical protein